MESGILKPGLMMHAVVLIFGISVVLNYGWELLQAPLYVGMEAVQDRWWHCFLASLADGLLVILIVLIGWIVFRDRNWYRQPGLSGYVLMAVSGFVIAAVIEKLALFTGRWSYTADMPVVPGLQVGVVPLAQLLLLPPVVFRVVRETG